MGLLICRPVSARSRPEKIREWIEDLRTLRVKHQAVPAHLDTIDRCIRQAEGWLAAEPLRRRTASSAR